MTNDFDRAGSRISGGDHNGLTNHRSISREASGEPFSKEDFREVLREFFISEDGVFDRRVREITEEMNKKKWELMIGVNCDDIPTRANVRKTYEFAERCRTMFDQAATNIGRMILTAAIIGVVIIAAIGMSGGGVKPLVRKLIE
jgi:hypothetical protein